MREQLERKKNNSSIVATVSFPSSRGVENMMTPSNDSSLMARGASLGATNPPMNSVMTAVSGGGGGGNNMAPLQNGSNFLADSTTRLVARRHSLATVSCICRWVQYSDFK